ncbi:MAG: hypothetical protein K2H39_08825, partial [Paramuribaculum sp.]|nr:hypothetical protein [Paramuribaculum sp.]
MNTIGMLHEAGRYAESLELTDYVMANAPNGSPMHYLHFWKALNHFNRGDFALAQRELAVADSIAIFTPAEDAAYYESFAGRLRDVLTYRQTDILPLIQLARQNNITSNRLYRLETARS